jgi:DNA polymerase-3 subunit epsilon
MKLLIIDTETTGLKPEEHHCLEIGAILFDVPSRQILAQMSCLLPVDSNAAEAINRIPAAVTRLPQPWKPGLDYFQELLNAADLLVAHNAAFDQQWFSGQGSLPPTPLPWICSMDDIQWPLNSKRGRSSVVSLCVDYGVPVWQAHRALTDCIYLAEVMKREPQLEQLIEDALLPRHVYVSNLGYDQRQRCKEAGFTWNNLVPKMWAKKMTEHEAAGLGFSVSIAE